MSTRAVVVLKDCDSVQKFYRHSDGYPRGTMPSLKIFMKYLKRGDIRDNVTQSAGWLVLIGAKEYNYKWKNGKHIEKTIDEILEPLVDWKAGSYEPLSHRKDNDISSAIEYLYIIDLPKKTLTCQNYKGDRIDISEYLKDE